MTTQQTDLPAFLRARFDEDERAARVAKPGPWHSDGDSVYATHPTDEVVDYSESAAHIAAHDPARVLRDIEAKRRMVDLYETVRAACDASADNYVAWLNNGPLPHSDEAEGTSEQKSMRAGLEAALRLLALPYADHPDYRDDWRP